jgi:hypothetical protein
MSKDTDMPPTLPPPTAKAGPKAAAAKKTEGKKTEMKKDTKEKLAALKAKKLASRPVAKLTLGIKRDGKYEFVKREFTSVKDAMVALREAVDTKVGKGLHEVILGIRG